jgi:hypothetical protein
MESQAAKKLVEKVFKAPYSQDNFIELTSNIFKTLTPKNESLLNPSINDCNSTITFFNYLGLYDDAKSNLIGLFEVVLANTNLLHKARATQRNVIAKQMKVLGLKGALVSFTSQNSEEWRFSFIKLESSFDLSSGKLRFIEELSPSKRQSFIVGQSEGSHTAMSQILPLLASASLPTFSCIEDAFRIEPVNDDFYEQYKELYLQLYEYLNDFIKNDPVIEKDFKEKEINASDFAKKTLGQFVFLYFIQKKGWIKNKKNPNEKFSFKNLFENHEKYGPNFFNDLIEPIFYIGLTKNEGTEIKYEILEDFDFPYLNGGLFEPLRNYDWKNTNIVIPNDFFFNTIKTSDGEIGSGLFDVFDRFNFTVYENDPLEQDIAVDPEMLGKVFENLLEITDRKSKGSFYTPRVIVQYMCQDALIHYLSNELGGLISIDDITFFVRNNQILDYKNLTAQFVEENSAVKLIKDHAALLDNLLAIVKICDPAIGSGAFPLGMLNEIIRARSSVQSFLKDQSSMYELKIHTIANSIYGVDIDPSAIEIARLRFWLSLVVEEEEPLPLPNLDHKLMQGDSLISEFEGIQLFNDEFLNDANITQKEIEHNKQKQNELQKQYILLNEQGKLTREKKLELDSELKKIKKLLDKLKESNSEAETKNLFDFKNETSVGNEKIIKLQEKIARFVSINNKEDKDRLRQEIDNLKWDLIELTLKEQNKSENLELIRNLRKKRINPFFIWKLEFADIFKERGGFDIVIGNPPYLAAITAARYLSEAVREQYKNKYQTAQGTYDMYVLFFELGINILKINGYINLITPSKFLAAHYAIELRKFISEYSLIKISDYEKNVFETAEVSTISTLIQKIPSVPEKIDVVKIISKNQIASGKHIYHERHNLNKFPEGIIGFLLSDHADLLQKILTKSILLGEISTVGASATAAEGDLFKKHIYESDSDNYQKIINTKTISNIYNLWGRESYKLDKSNILTPFLNLNQINLRRQAMYKLPKLIFKKLTTKVAATFDVNGEFASTATTFVYDPIENYSLAFLAGYLNSKLINFYITKAFGGYSMGKSFQIQAPQLKIIPVPVCTPESQQAIVGLVNKILQAKKSDAEADVQVFFIEIDQLIYQIFNLSNIEISSIENID